MIHSLRKRLRPFFSFVDSLSDIIVSIALLSIVGVVILQIFARLFAIPAAWTEETSRYLFIWMMFIGVSASMRHGEAARVTYFVLLMPPLIQRFSRFLYTLVSASFFLFTIVTGLGLVFQQMSMKEMGTAVQMPMWIIGACVPICGFLGLINLAGCLLLNPESIEGGN